MAHMLPRNAQADGWERSDFPIVCESCLGGNPYVRMTRADCDKECKICMRLFTVFGWKLGSDASRKMTEICQSCSKLKNVCQVCLLDLEYGLPVQVRDSALSINSNDAIPKSDVNHEYFTEEDDRLGVHKISTRTAQIRLVSSHPEVYEPCDDSFVLVDALLSDRLKLIEHQPKICLEIGCGSGYVIASLALMLSQDVSGIQYFATDINLHATETTRQTLEAHGIHVEVIATDIASGLHRRLAGMVDVVVVNPPYVPTPEEEVGCEGITASWAGGENGRRVIDRILPVVNELLSERGWLYMVTLTANNPSQICRLMREKGYASKIVLQRSTQEESLHVVKFWRNAAADETKEGNKGVPSGSESWLSQFSLFSFLTGNQNSS